MRRPGIVAVTKPYHGLGNRVRVVLSSQVLAASTGRAFSYVWPTGRPFGARLDQLWHTDLTALSPLRSRLLSLRHPYRDAGLEWMPEAAGDDLWQIRTSQPLALPEGPDAWHPLLRALRPVDEVASHVNRVFDEHFRGAPYVGVMVRTHAISHENTLRESPLEWYLDRLSEIRRDHGPIPFFVSADTVEAQDRLVAAFPGTVGLGDKGPYNSLQALRLSLADLYLLAGSTHIVGPHYSSFPELALYLAGPSIRLETSMTPASTRLTATERLTRVDDPTRPAERVSNEG